MEDKLFEIHPNGSASKPTQVPTGTNDIWVYSDVGSPAAATTREYPFRGDSGYNTEVSPAFTNSPVASVSSERFLFDDHHEGQNQIQNSQWISRLHQYHDLPPSPLANTVSSSSFTYERCINPTPQVDHNTVVQENGEPVVHFEETTSYHGFQGQAAGVYRNEGLAIPIDKDTKVTRNTNYHQLRLSNISDEEETDSDGEEKYLGSPHWSVRRMSLRERTFCSTKEDAESSERRENALVISPLSKLSPDLSANGSRLPRRDKFYARRHEEKQELLSDAAATSSPLTKEETDNEQNMFCFDEEQIRHFNLSEINTENQIDVQSRNSLPYPSSLLHDSRRSSQTGQTTSPDVNVSSRSSHLRLSNGFFIPVIESSRHNHVSVSTQTPHAASQLITEVIESPAALPIHATGTAIGRIRHSSSESDGNDYVSLAPLPDLVPERRDRSMSAPNLQIFGNRYNQETGRQIGRELRRLSDEFNFMHDNRFRGLILPEFDGEPGSFPQDRREQPDGWMGLRNFISTIRRNNGSSVDLHADLD